ncbi:MAG: FAD-dependent oxidoreductase [Alphaproteobacteria bacterium]|nr:FAD-dependent oxidoreductase [Alphaproteobacteria bacterium]
MIFDLNKIAAGEPHRGYDVCIAGAGVAGITLAIDLASRGRRVLLLEGGDLEFTETSQNTYKGPIIGRNYFDLDFARLRYLGGASNHWAGWCRPLDAWDFEGHAHIPNSGWPIAKADLDRHFERASRILEIPAEYNDKPVEDSDNAFTQFEFQFSPPVRFGEKYLEELKSSTRIDLFVNANLTDIRLTEATDRVTEFQCSNYTDRAAKHSFTGAAFVLAMGGIEIPRMMLNFRSQATAGIGNAHDLVGRYFMDHFHASGGVYAARRKDWPYSANEIHFAPTPEFMARQKIANAGLRAGPLTDARRALINRAKHSLFCNEDEVRGFARSFFEGSCPADVFTGGYLRVASEQQPNPSSRVSLSDDTDKFGLRRPALDWQISALDRHTIKHMVIGFGRYIASRKYGNVKMAEWLLDDGDPVPQVGEDRWLGAGFHHMGTTRMASTPDKGVVDENCGVFGLDNLFIAGSSVFPTCGHANPTLPIVQLTLRLGEHLAGKIKT